jgi:hypothetical protein
MEAPALFMPGYSSGAFRDKDASILKVDGKWVVTQSDLPDLKIGTATTALNGEPFRVPFTSIAATTERVGHDEILRSHGSGAYLCPLRRATLQTLLIET